MGWIVEVPRFDLLAGFTRAGHWRDLGATAGDLQGQQLGNPGGMSSEVHTLAGNRCWTQDNPRLAVIINGGIARRGNADGTFFYNPVTIALLRPMASFMLV